MRCPFPSFSCVDMHLFGLWTLYVWKSAILINFFFKRDLLQAYKLKTNTNIRKLKLVWLQQKITELHPTPPLPQHPHPFLSQIYDGSPKNIESFLRRNLKWVEVSVFVKKFPSCMVEETNGKWMVPIWRCWRTKGQSISMSFLRSWNRELLAIWIALCCHREEESEKSY